MESHRGNCERTIIEKFDIKLKSKPKDGVILQLHHTIRGSKGECRRIRFSTGVFDDTHERLACTDNVGNLFILDFADLKFWKIQNSSPCSCLHFVPEKEDTLLVATTKNFEINLVDFETGDTSITLSGHTAPIKHVSFSKKIPNFLTSSSVEAILWELENYTKYFTLNTYLGAQIQQILFTPGGDYLVACFQNDTIQIWKQDTMKSVKQIIPNELTHMKGIAFTVNGRAMAMGGLAPTLILFSMDTWKAIKSIDLTKYKISGAQQLAFIPQLFDGGANKILAILSSDCNIHLLNLETLSIICQISPESSGIRKFVVSPTGKYFLCILQLGEVNIYNSSYVLEKSDDSYIECDKTAMCCKSANSHVSRTPSVAKTYMQEQMKISMDSARLRRILMQYGEYPEKFRSLIWTSLLDMPKNKVAYSSLLEKGAHLSYKNIEEQFTIHSTITLKNLKRLLSCLAHWCPLFGVMKFLPGFVFPFVKVLQKDPLLLFECSATILLNYCQLWFEYAPFPPISVLAMIENILAEHDQQLLDHFVEVGITSQTYALKILETAFSEVLTCTEWLILWDHIISNEPAFIVMAVVSYNIVQKNALKKLKRHEQLENFFHMQNPIDKKTFLKKTYVLLNDTPDDIHPRKFFNEFVPLEKGDCYQQFTAYPKATICLKLAKMQKKEPKSHNYTLKDLTTKSQEKLMNERFNKADKSKRHGKAKDDDFNYYTKDTNTKIHEKKGYEHPKNMGDYNRNHVKSELIENSLYAKSMKSQKSGDGSFSKSTGRDKESKKSAKSSKIKYKTNSPDKEAENLAN